MSYETILYNIDNGVATITLNRPDFYNALNNQMYKDLTKALRDIERDTAVRAVLLTGAGKGFCSGADLMELNAALSQGFSVGDVLRTGLNPLITAFRALEKPVICALNGVAAGAGASLALACDFRFAAENASFVFAAFVNIGIIPDGGATYMLTKLVGPARALELAILANANQRLLATKALEWGLVNRIVPADDLLVQATQFARDMASMATRAIGMTKRAIYRAADRAFADALEYEAQVQEGAFRTQDFREGVQAFLEKRSANFTGS